jgi:spermidine/putrescine transport system permease protein
VRSARALAVAGFGTLAFLYLPVLVLAVFSFNSGAYAARWEGTSLVWYERLLAPDLATSRAAEGLGAATAASLRLAAGAAVLAVLLSGLTALGLRGARRALAAPFLALWALPIVLPDVVLGVSWSEAFRFLGVEPGFGSLLAAHGTLAAAFGLVVVRARLSTLDGALVEAARDLGATRRGAFVHVVLPHLRPALVAVGLLAFTLSFDDFMVTLFLAPPTEPTLPLRMNDLIVRGASPVLHALATLTLAGTLVVSLLALRLVRPR